MALTASFFQTGPFTRGDISMQREEQIRLLKILMGHLDADTNVDAGGLRENPSWVYTCPEHADKEWELFFRRHPQVIGMSADLPEPGRFITVNDFGVPILATRDQAGRFRAFANICRHRGTVVEDEPCGKKRSFSCRFHAWTYSNSGELLSIPKSSHFGEIDRAKLGLVEYPAAEKYGLLWVHPVRDEDLDVDALLGGLAPEFESWDFGSLALAGVDTFEMPLNWKLAVDTFGETYHFSTLHKNSLARTFHGNVQGYDTYGRNHRMTLCLKAIDDMRRKPESEWQITEGANPNYYLFPNIQLNVGQHGSTVLVRTYPDPKNVSRSISRISFYAPKFIIDNFADQFADSMNFFASIIRDEDYVAAASSQVGANAGVVEKFIFGRNEPALHHYHNTYREALGMEPLPLLPG
jgi:phenylpropionate dioxygenase-like ring-hydroxylating dioxygenase large terminal subunit